MAELITDAARKREVVRYSGIGPPVHGFDDVIQEVQLRMVVNGGELLVASILPEMQVEFAYGILLSSGLINTAREVRECQLDSERGIIFVELASAIWPPLDYASPPTTLYSACGSEPLTVSTNTLSPLHSDLAVSYGVVLASARSVQQDSQLFSRTGGVHSVALFTPAGDQLARSDDIGRHNAFDKVMGAILLKDHIDPGQCFAVCTGRLSSEIVIKAWRAGIPVLVSRSCATSRALEIAEDAGITLVGFARGQRFNVYCHPERIGGGDA